MYKELFVEYLKMVLPHKGSNSANPKTISDYIDGLSGRIAPYAKKYNPSFVDIFQLDFVNAERIRTLLLEDEEFVDYCKSSNNVQKTALNHYSKFIGYVKGIKLNIDENVRGKERALAKEGEPYECHCIEYKRDKELRNSVARDRKYTCEICGSNLKEIYGSIADEFIEVHHKDPVHEGVRETTKDDLICVCPNCHSILHRLNPALVPEDLKLRIKITKNRELI